MGRRPGVERGESLSGYRLPSTSDTGPVLDVVETTRFAWVAAIAGVLLALVGLRWIVAHLTRERVQRLSLPGSTSQGRLDAAGTKVMAAAAEAYADTIGVRSAHGSLIRDRGQLVGRIDATVEPDADLALLARRADEVSGQLAGVLERDDLRCSVRLQTPVRARALPRAR